MTTESILKKHFPMLRTVKDVLHDIHSNSHLLRQYQNWSEEQQQEFMNICTGTKGVKMVYDTFFKEVMNPEYTPERVGDFLSVLLKQKVTVFHDYPDDYLHYIEAKSDTGIEIPLLQKYLFIPLDIFKKNVQNKINIDNKVEAWLRFFSVVKCGNLLFIYVKNSFIPRTFMSVGA